MGGAGVEEEGEGRSAVGGEGRKGGRRGWRVDGVSSASNPQGADRSGIGEEGGLTGWGCGEG